MAALRPVAQALTCAEAAEALLRDEDEDTGAGADWTARLAKAYYAQA